MYANRYPTVRIYYMYSVYFDGKKERPVMTECPPPRIGTCLQWVDKSRANTSIEVINNWFKEVKNEDSKLAGQQHFSFVSVIYIQSMRITD